MEQVTSIRIECQGATLVSLEELHNLQGNLKDLSEKNYVKLRNSIIEFGFSFPIFYWQDQDGTKWILDAHQRVRTLQKMKEDGIEIPQLPADPIMAENKQQAKKKLLLLNSQYGQMTQEGFDEFTADIEIDDIADLLALDNVMLDGASTNNTIEDEAPEVDTENEAISKLGEVYQVGRHRLMCGDATKIEDVEKLMNGQKADMVFTDPPYNVNYSGRGKNTSNTIKNDDMDMDMDTFYQFLLDSFTSYCQFSKTGACLYVCHADGKPMVRATFEKAFNELFTQSCTIIWKKNVASMGWQDYRGQHEPILYGWNKGEHKFYGDRSQTTIWEVGREGDYKHPTQKPIVLIAKAINNSSKSDDIVLDLFGGSGSTLIAAEQTNRTCMMSEIDPKYVDVIRKRYAKFIGKENEWQEVTPIVNE